nr:hypothetical protein [Mycobacterium sp.]
MRLLNMTSRNADHIEAVLRKIGRRVLEDVWKSGRARAFAVMAMATLVGVTIVGWLGLAAEATTSWLSCIAITLFGLTALVSSVAVCRLRFRWCCAAAYVSAIAAVAGLGMVWWHRTAPPGSSSGPSAWMVIGVLTAAILNLAWLSVILTPSERSQPDMRAASASAHVRCGPQSA